MPTTPPQPLLIACELCGLRLPTRRDCAWRDAIDHALDEHRAKLLGEPDSARKWLRFLHPDGRAARISRDPRKDGVAS